MTAATKNVKNEAKDVIVQNFEVSAALKKFKKT